MEGMNEDFILEAIFKLRTENTEVHDKIIDYFINQYDEYSQSSEDDVSEGVKDFRKKWNMNGRTNWKIWIVSLRQQLIQ